VYNNDSQLDRQESLQKLGDSDVHGNASGMYYLCWDSRYINDIKLLLPQGWLLLEDLCDSQVD